MPLRGTLRPSTIAEQCPHQLACWHNRLYWTAKSGMGRLYYESRGRQKGIPCISNPTQHPADRSGFDFGAPVGPVPHSHPTDHPQRGWRATLTKAKHVICRPKQTHMPGHATKHSRALVVDSGLYFTNTLSHSLGGRHCHSRSQDQTRFVSLHQGAQRVRQNQGIDWNVMTSRISPRMNALSGVCVSGYTND
jgi:hypothetical protein